jgi:hypothetical protein
VEVRLAGSFGVRRDDTELAGQAVGSRKSRLLLKLLAVERPALVPVDRIADVLWAGRHPAAPGRGARPGPRRAAAAGRAADDEQALAEGLDGLKAAYLCQGDAAALAGVLAELVPLLRRHGDLFRLQWSEFESAFMAIAAADWGRAAAAIASAIEVNRRGGYPYSAAWYVAHQCWLAGLRGYDAEAPAAGRRALALALAQDSEHAWWVAATCAMLSETVLRTGRHRPARARPGRGAGSRRRGLPGLLRRAAGGADRLPRAAGRSRGPAGPGRHRQRRVDHRRCGVPGRGARLGRPG